MTEQAQNSQAAASQDQKQNDKEVNFRALEKKYQAQLEHERAARIEAERIAQEAISRKQNIQDDEEDESDPYVDHKKLKRKLDKFGQQTMQQTQGEIQKEVHKALTEERKNNWLKQNGDFYEVLQHAEKLAVKDPELAESILEMPESFERQKLVYKNIKALGLHKPEVKQASIQDKIDANKKSPYYQPSSVGSPAYASSADYSQSGQKQAYEKMQELKNRLRI